MTVETIDPATGEVLPSLAECEATIERGVRSYIITGLCVVALLACLYVLPRLMWDVLTLDPATPED